MLKPTLQYGTLILIIVAAITLFLPVELYDGVAVLVDGTMVDEKLSLSYLLNKQKILASDTDLGVTDIRLKFVGWILVGIINVGLPYLLGFRIALAKERKDEES